MPKKSRRAKVKRNARSARAIQGKYSQLSKPAAAEPQLSAAVSLEEQDSIGRYQYVLPELRRIGILAGAIIVILVVLSFVIG